MKKILFVDDDEAVRYALCKYLRRSGFEVTEAEDGINALKYLASNAVDVLITDIIMPNMEGIELLRNIGKLHPGLPVIAISGGGRVGQEEYLSLAHTLGATATMEKPLDPDQLLRLIEEVGK
ncbi:response regulator [uncultured Neptuniibacter sp.]|uniref:response regulator n=1 Tax=uncultured Neptuniibacter sp. TaxID=502143 RepID=UPI00261D1E93|nr:response regulator [uncultured Neptuniibacter sp.]